jgi:hypothetical protein
VFRELISQLPPKSNGPLIASEQRPPKFRDSLYSLAFTDARARIRCQMWTVGVGIAYAVQRTVGSSENASETARGMILFMSATFVVYTISYCLKPFEDHAATVTRLPLSWRRILDRATKISVPVLVGCALLLFLPGTIKNHVALAILARTEVGVLPGESSGSAQKSLTSRFQEQTGTVKQRLKAGIPGNDAELRRTRERLEAVVQGVALPADLEQTAANEIVYLNAYEALTRAVLAPSHQTPMVLKGPGEDVPGSGLFAGSNGGLIEADSPLVLTDYRLVSKNPATQVGQAIRRGNNEVPVAIVRVRVIGFPQMLDGITWIDVTFDHAKITYSGGPLYLSNVKFVGCTFDFPPKYQDVLNYIQENSRSGVTLYRPASN